MMLKYELTQYLELLATYPDKDLQRWIEGVLGWISTWPTDLIMAEELTYTYMVMKDTRAAMQGVQKRSNFNFYDVWEVITISNTTAFAAAAADLPIDIPAIPVTNMNSFLVFKSRMADFNNQAAQYMLQSDVEISKEVCKDT
jgi:hypothetical protein